MARQRRRYDVYFKPSAEREFRRLPEDQQRRLVAEIELLAFDPRPDGVVKMAGAENLWRLRVGRYRVVYEIHDREVDILVFRTTYSHKISVWHHARRSRCGNGHGSRHLDLPGGWG